MLDSQMMYRFCEKSQDTTERVIMNSDYTDTRAEVLHGMILHCSFFFPFGTNT